MMQQSEFCLNLKYLEDLFNEPEKNLFSSNKIVSAKTSKFKRCKRRQRCSIAAIITRESVSRFGSGPSGSGIRGSQKNPAIPVLPPMNAEAFGS